EWSEFLQSPSISISSLVRNKNARRAFEIILPVRKEHTQVSSSTFSYPQGQRDAAPDH
ncbi:hypothetical protein FOMG_19609, partial [Fusarium oxysporum f. sp. melonis 26406]